MIEIIFLAPIIFIILNAKKPNFMKNRYTLVLSILSVTWWVFLVINQLRTTLNCNPGDDLCNYGNTVSGGLMWGSMLAMYTLSIVWIAFTLISYIVANRKKIKSKPRKVKS